ncbi:MAG: O-antigen ligase family protein [Planctomycetaceae bacterium]|jgi:O-antigen ligase|nr:O-antigen ligase family protein [Planctomycetaceae bacterium]
MNTFLYGDEKPHWQNFFHRAAIRLAIAYPVIAAISISAADVFALLILLFWFLSGHWRERCDFVKKNTLILVSLPFIVLTFSGIFRDWLITGDYKVLLESTRYWWGHYPLFFSLIIATLLLKKETWNTALSSINSAIILLWILVLLFGSGLLPESYRLVDVSSLNLYRNKIHFGMGLVLWSGLWICVPFTSRNIPLVRRFLPLSFLLGMKEAAQISPIGLLLFPFRKRRYVLTLCFLLLRWGTVCLIGYYLFWFNPSRTAQLSFLCTISVLIISWNWKKGGILAVLFCVLTVIIAQCCSPVFESKATRTINDIKEFTTDILNNTNTLQSHDRLMIWKQIFPSICEKPIFGHGMELGRKEVKDKTGFVDPHNEFINITLEFGLLGLITFLFWLIFSLNHFRNGVPVWNYLGLFIATALIIDNLYNCGLSYDRESHLFCVLIGILYVTDFTYNRRTKPLEKQQSSTPLSIK